LPKDGRLAPDAYATDLLAVMDRLGIQRAVLVGHSLGGGVAVAAAGLWPNRVAGLLLVDPIDDPSKRPADPSAAAFLQRLEGPEYEVAIASYWAQILEFASEGTRQRVLADLRSTPRETVVGSMKGMAGFDAQAALADYHGPMLSITTLLNEFPSSLHNVVIAIKHERVTDVSHWLHLDRPDAFNATLDRFLTSIP
jgi:pimeloyl-ACP methyl ester carboxylesterase